MTKYGHYLAALDRDSPPTFRGRFLAYKGLKKCLKQCQGAAAAGARAPAGGEAAALASPDGAPFNDLEVCSARFFELLKQELRKTNLCFVSSAKSIVAGFQRAEVRRRLVCCLPRLLGGGPRQYAHLAERAYWCRKYARANAVALRKILKKYDKVCGGQRGRSFLQQCWRLPSGGAFLHSPLLDELKAIQDMLHEERLQHQQHEDIALCEVANTSVKAGSKTVAAMAAAAAGVGDGAQPPAGGLLSGGLPRGALALAPGGSPAVTPGPAMPASPTSQQGGTGQNTSNAFGSPSCMLSSSDFEWSPEDAAASPCPLGLPAGRHLAHLERPSLDCSMLSLPLSTSTDYCFSPGTSPPGPGAFTGGDVAALLLHGAGAPWGGEAAATQAAVTCTAEASAGGGVAGGGSGATAEATPTCTASPGVHPVGLDRSCISRFREEDLRCPICLEVFYKPVGLVCGHKFCKRCALEWASLGNAVGTFANLCSYVAPSLACPQCRQPGVYKGAQRVRMLDRVLRSRYPDEWQERRQEERQMKCSAVETAVAPNPHRHWMQTLNAREALLGM